MEPLLDQLNTLFSLECFYTIFLVSFSYWMSVEVLEGYDNDK